MTEKSKCFERSQVIISFSLCFWYAILFENALSKKEQSSMADEIVYKKVTRKADKGVEGKIIAKHGKQTNQKLKPYVVLEYLMKYFNAPSQTVKVTVVG